MDPSLSTSNSKLKRVRGITVFLLTVFALDYFSGLYLAKRHKEIKRGEIGLVNKIIQNADEDILIFGSSRAKFHYDSSIIEAETGKSCYNAGFNGRGLLLSAALITEMLKRHKPSVVILDINFMNNKYEDEYKKIDILRPFYSDSSEIKELLDFKAPLEKVRHLSKAFPYNATIPALIERELDRSDGENNKGASKLKGSILKDAAEEKISKYKLDEDLLEALYRLSDLCIAKKVKLIVCISPALTKYNSDSIKQIRDGLQGKGVSFFDFTSSERFKLRKIFYDSQHLNDFGSIVYSRKVGKILKETLK